LNWIQDRLQKWTPVINFGLNITTAPKAKYWPLNMLFRTDPAVSVFLILNKGENMLKNMCIILADICVTGKQPEANKHYSQEELAQPV
jgi:hypothetical protein